jgi:UDP-N-acetylmuramoyl-L-alanyl-D-glutamate--2,6-diaminopimelate ligase
VNIVTNFSLGETVLETVDTAIKSLCERAKFAVVNLDDDLGFQLLSSATEANKIFAYSINEPALQKKTHDAVEKIYVENVRLDMTGIHANVVSPWGSGELQTQLLGRFNLSNILASLTTLCLLEIPFEKVLHCMSHLKSAPGRMQVLGGRTQPLVVVDSAKSPESLEKILFALREHCHRKLYCVFGCDGDTDQERRSLMGMIAEMYADHIVVTSDNPGDVDALEIIADIQRGFSEPKHVVIEMDRTKAIRDVIKQAVVGDCILVAGKGVEVYQVVGDEKISFSDVEIINEVLDH